MKIAVCEDQIQEADWLCQTIKKWSVKKKVVMEIQAFTNAMAFCFTLEDTIYDALFLDIKMPGEDGVSLAKRLREKENTIPIVFVTGEKEYIMEGYEVEAVNYLLKPVEEEKVWECLDRIYEKRKHQEPFVIIKTEETMIKLLQKEIYMIEVFDHRLRYITEKGNYEVYSSLKEAEKELQKNCFVSCYRGVLVNLWHVETIGKNVLVLENEKTKFHMEVPVSRRLYNQVNEAFIAFYKGEIAE